MTNHPQPGEQGRRPETIWMLYRTPSGKLRWHVQTPEGSACRYLKLPDPSDDSAPARWRRARVRRGVVQEITGDPPTDSAPICTHCLAALKRVRKTRPAAVPTEPHLRFKPVAEEYLGKVQRELDATYCRCLQRAVQSNAYWGRRVQEAADGLTLAVFLWEVSVTGLTVAEVLERVQWWRRCWWEGTRLLLGSVHHTCGTEAEKKAGPEEG
jgi:hypothetical protein